MRSSLIRSVLFITLPAGLATMMGCREAGPPVATVDNSWAGTWTLDLGKSTYGLSPTPRSIVSRLEPVDSGLKVSEEVVDAQGKVTTEEFRGTFDGKDHPIVAGGPVTVALTKIDDYTVDLVMKRDGVRMTTTRMVVAPNGKTRTSTTMGRNDQGKPASNVAVYAKQK